MVTMSFYMVDRRTTFCNLKSRKSLMTMTLCQPMINIKLLVGRVITIVKDLWVWEELVLMVNLTWTHHILWEYLNQVQVRVKSGDSNLTGIQIHNILILVFKLLVVIWTALGLIVDLRQALREWVIDVVVGESIKELVLLMTLARDMVMTRT